MLAGSMPRLPACVDCGVEVASLMAKNVEPPGELNPYRPPAEHEVEFAAGKRQLRVWFRWRVIPFALCAFNGLSGLIAGFAAPFASILMLLFAKRPPQLWYLPIIVSPLAVIAGFAWLKASQAWLQGRWRNAILLTSLLCALCMIPPAIARAWMR